MTEEITMTEEMMVEQTTATAIEHITPLQLRQMVSEIVGCAFVSVDLVMPMDKKGKMLVKSRETREPNPFFGIGLKKKETITGCLGFSYGHSVEAQLAREDKDPDSYEAGKRAWGTPVDLNEKSGAYKLIEHKGNYYLHMMGLSYNGKVMGVKFGVPVYEDAEGKVYEKAELAEYLPAKSKSKRQGTDKEIRCHDCGFASIVAIRMNGKEYIVTEATPEIEAEHRQNATQATEPVTQG